MSNEAPAHVAFFGDQRRTFRLTPDMIMELERVTGRGIGGLARSLFASDFRLLEITEVIRLALIGGGTEPQEATALIAAYVVPRPIMEPYGLAVSILQTAMLGPVKRTKRAKPISEDGQ
jgi:hypothetical protein